MAYLDENGAKLIVSKIKNITDTKANSSDVYTKEEVDNKIKDVELTAGDNITITDKVISSKDTTYSISYKDKTIYLTDNEGTSTSIDATLFIKDGMIDSVKLEGNNLVITFNTDSGKEDISIDLSKFVDVYTAGDNVTITNNVISAIDTIYDDTEVKSEIAKKQDTLIAGDNITIENNTITATDTVYDDTDIKTEIAKKQDVLTAGDNITIVDNTISATSNTYTGDNGITISDNIISLTYPKIKKIIDLENYEGEEGEIVQYVGETIENYVKGYFYICKKTETGEKRAYIADTNTPKEKYPATYLEHYDILFDGQLYVYLTDTGYYIYSLLNIDDEPFCMSARSVTKTYVFTEQTYQERVYEESGVTFGGTSPGIYLTYEKITTSSWQQINVQPSSESDITAIKAQVETNTTNISNLTTQVETNTTNIELKANSSDLSDNISEVKELINSESERAETAENELKTSIESKASISDLDTINTNLQGQIDTLATDKANVSDLETLITSEASTRESADNTLTENIATLSDSIATAQTDIENLTTELYEEANARKTADEELQTNKQDVLTAGTGINISSDNTISFKPSIQSFSGSISCASGSTITKTISTSLAVGVYLAIMYVTWESSTSAVYNVVFNSNTTRASMVNGGGETITTMMTLSAAVSSISFTLYQASGSTCTANYKINIIRLT